MSDLFVGTRESTETVECLGIVFPNQEARRTHFLGLLREKLKDTEFRKIVGFPVGTDEAILSLSDPPYYTVCPNPFIADFVRLHAKQYDPREAYRKEPFAADVSEGKNDPIYNAHSYHTKVPHKAIMRYLLHYTQPGDVVFDGFCGTGMTGIAAQLCGERAVVESLGYRVDADGTVLEAQMQNGQTHWKPFSKLGVRRAILNDLSPIASFIASRYNDFRASDFETNSLLDSLLDRTSKLGSLYVTAGPKSDAQRSIDYVIWSELYSCPACQHVESLFDLAVDRKTGELSDEFECPSCRKTLKKDELVRVWSTTLDLDGHTVLKEAKSVPVEVVAQIGARTVRFPPTQFDFDLLRRIDSIALEGVPDAAFPHGRQTRKVKTGSGIEKVHQMFTRRALLFVSNAWSLTTHNHSSASRRAALFLLSGTIALLSKRERYRDGTGKGAQSGTLYVPSLQVEKNAFDVVDRKRRALARLPLRTQASNTVVTVGSHEDLAPIPDDSVDYIFTDPPFGESLQYAELNFFHEAWLQIRSAIDSDCVLNYVHHKDLAFYQRLMRSAFAESFRILKPGRWMTVEFSNTQASVWNAIQTALQEAGFVVANVSALDKKQGSFNSVTTTTSVKQDLVISAYKPNGGLEERFTNALGGEESVWDFVRTHLGYLASVKLRNGQVEFIAERDPRIIFDRLVAWFVRHNAPIPLGSAEFQAGLVHRFAERDGMVFLPEQVAEYDKRRLLSAQAPQMELFVADERSAIDWLTDLLRKRPSTYQEIHPEFIKQLGAGWKKHEAKPELLALLQANFLMYDSAARDALQVPTQISSYLSKNFHDYRGIERSHPSLKAKAEHRWFVPDPTKAQELEKLRETHLLREFERYKAHAGRKLSEFRLEVVRAGFKHAWGNRDYGTIISIAKKIPEDVLQEDEKLLLWYDQALTRTESDA